jgi:hypothetical protein
MQVQALSSPHQSRQQWRTAIANQWMQTARAKTARNCCGLTEPSKRILGGRSSGVYARLRAHTHALDLTAACHVSRTASGAHRALPVATKRTLRTVPNRLPTKRHKWTQCAARETMLCRRQVDLYTSHAQAAARSAAQGTQETQTARNRTHQHTINSVGPSRIEDQTRVEREHCIGFRESVEHVR